MITIEDGVIMGGFGSAVLEALAAAGITNVQITNLGFQMNLLSTVMSSIFTHRTNAMLMLLFALHRQCWDEEVGYRL